MSATVDEVLELLQASSAKGYFGEAVTQLEHALQCAEYARLAKAEDELIAAALLHDVGHLIDSDRHEACGAEWLRERGFSERVVELVGGHVDAKRYLTATNPEYLGRLSEASTRTLAQQGGPMSAEEVRAFAGDPLFKEKLRLRSWDEQAKIPGAITAPLESYRALLENQAQTDLNVAGASALDTLR